MRDNELSGRDTLLVIISEHCVALDFYNMIYSHCMGHVLDSLSEPVTPKGYLQRLQSLPVNGGEMANEVLELECRWLGETC